MEKLPDLKRRMKEAEKLRKKLERSEAVKPEASARKKLLSAREWIEKNRARIKRWKAVRERVRNKLREVIEKHPDTRAARDAEKDLAALGAE